MTDAHTTRAASIQQLIGAFRTPRPHERFLRRFRGLRVVINGPIGAGKTTLTSILNEVATANGLPTMVMYERVPMDKLQAFIEEEKRIAPLVPRPRNAHAFALQMEILEYRLADAALAIKHAATQFVILDRSVQGDYVFARANYEMGNFTESEWLQYMARLAQVNVLEQDIYVHLGVDLATTMARIDKRARTGEDKYDPAYLRLLHTIDDAVTDAMTCPVLRLEWNADRDVMDADERHRTGMNVFMAMDALMLRDANVAEGHLRVTTC